MKLETLAKNWKEANASDSGDPLVTSLIIIGVMVVVALAIYLAFGNVMADRADDVAQDIEDSGSHFENRNHVEFDNHSG
ncbi:hypothetical protein [Nesterenkonia alba]|uniref:hypothetical protein n=1 Tax=Nesterenkonia alba TaxID=515814 RepID=UPI0003B762B4|nr:hypothetical protein [Nesterenkonia alba]